MYVQAPFTIVVDTAEQHPFTFDGFLWDANKQQADMLVPIVYGNLGRYPDSYGDYGLKGHERKVCIERKSIPDLIGTVLGWSDQVGPDSHRRMRFEKELKNLSTACSAVIVEGSYESMLASVYPTTHKTATVNAKTMERSLIAYQQDYSVPFIFAGSRRAAERITLRWFQRWFKHNGK